MKKYIVVKVYSSTDSTFIERAFETKSDAVAFAELLNKSESRDYIEYHVAKILEENEE